MKGDSEVVEEEERRLVRSVFACYNNNKMDRYLLPEPLPANGNLPEQWARFKKQFEQFLDASEKSGVSYKAKIAILLCTIGDKGNHIYENFVFEANEQPTLDDVLAKYEQFCKPRISVFAARHHFLTMKQNNLTIDEFLTAMKNQVRYCAFGELKDDMVLHALTLGLDNDRTRRSLFKTQKLTLDKAVNLCRLTEDSETEMRKMKINEEVSAVYKNEGKDSNTCQNASQKVTRADLHPGRTHV